MKKTALIAAVALGASAVLSVAGVSSASAASTRACIILPDADSGTRWEPGDRPALDKALKAAGFVWLLGKREAEIRVLLLLAVMPCKPRPSPARGSFAAIIKRAAIFCILASSTFQFEPSVTDASSQDARVSLTHTLDRPHQSRCHRRHQARVLRVQSSKPSRPKVSKWESPVGKDAVCPV
mgnify:CR=1 FL=1